MLARRKRERERGKRRTLFFSFQLARGIFFDRQLSGQLG
jgi:hypothetical protein